MKCLCTYESLFILGETAEQTLLRERREEASIRLAQEVSIQESQRERETQRLVVDIENYNFKGRGEH